MFLGHYDRAQEFERLDEGSEWYRFDSSGLALYRGNDSEALALIRQTAPEDPRNRDFLRAYLEHRPASELDALALAEERQMEGVRDSEQKYWTAGRLSYGGQAQLALRLLRRAIEQNFCAYPAMDRNPLLAAVRKLPEYSAVRAEGIACQQRFLAYRAAVTK